MAVTRTTEFSHPMGRPLISDLRGLWLSAAVLVMLGTPGNIEAKPPAKPTAEAGLRLRVRVTPAPDSATLARWLRQNSLRARAQRIERFRALGSWASLEEQSVSPHREGSTGLATQARAKTAPGIGAKAGAGAEAKAGSPTEAKRASMRHQERKSQMRAAGDGRPSAGAATQAGRDSSPRQEPARLQRDPMSSLKTMLKAGRAKDPASLDRSLKERIREEERRREHLKPSEGGRQHGGPGQHRPGPGGK